MASKELSILLLAKDMASKTIGNVNKEIGKLGKTGAIASRGLTSLGANLAKIGAVAAVGIGVAVKSGISSLAELESAVTSVDGAIAQLGLTGQVTGSQVATWANEIETATGSAFDDKAITAGAATLIRVGKLSESQLRDAMVVSTDLAAVMKTDIPSATATLAKSLADPTKATRALRQAGISLTKEEQKSIKSMVEHGKLAEAQNYILKRLAATTKDAALKSRGPYARAMSTLADVTENAQRALAEGFLPVLEKLAGKLSTAMSNPKFIEGIRSFGKGLASGLDSLISIAEKLPWGTIGTSLQIAGAGAKAILGAFVALPPWVQTAVITGWGLNKLTGGALGGIVGELGKGLIKGVLGINAAVVNINAATVNGGVPGTGPAAGGKGGAPGWLAKLAPLVLLAGKIGLLAGASLATGQALVGNPRARTGEMGGSRGEQFARQAAARDAALATANRKPVVLGPPSPAYAGVIERATARGLTPTKTGIQATLDKNARIAAAANIRLGDRLSAVAASVNATAAAIAAKSAAVPIVNVSTGFNVAISVRDTIVRTSVRRSYGTIAAGGRVGIS